MAAVLRLDLAGDVPIAALLRYFFLLLFEFGYDLIVVELRDDLGAQPEIMNANIRTIVSMYPNIIIELRGAAVIAGFPSCSV